MAEIIQFSSKQELQASDLNSVDDRFAEAVANVGLVWSELTGDWRVLELEDLTLDALIIHDVRDNVDDVERYINVTNPVRDDEISPSVPNSKIFVFTETRDKLYIGHRTQFSGIDILFAFTAGDVGLTIDYSSSSGWTSLTHTDNTAGFTTDNDITWTIPSGWIITSLNDLNESRIASNDQLYWLRFNFTTNQAWAFDKVTKQDLTGTNNPSLEVVQSSPLGRSVTVRRGIALIDGEFVVLDSDIVVGLNNPDSNDYIAGIQLNDSGDIVIDYGEEAATPNAPSTRVNAMKLADVELTPTTNTVLNAAITDQRIFV
jgi:hypothetical protein